MHTTVAGKAQATASSKLDGVGSMLLQSSIAIVYYTAIEHTGLRDLLGISIMGLEHLVLHVLDSRLELQHSLCGVLATLLLLLNGRLCLQTVLLSEAVADILSCTQRITH